MKIVFFATPKFAVPSLEELIKSRHQIVKVVTRPDRKKGRNLVLTAPAVKQAALKYNLSVCQPEDPDCPKFIQYLRKINSDIFVVVSYGHIFKKELLQIPPKGVINLHASLLPKYRGAAPVNWAIINGEKNTGVTIMRVNVKLDHGDIILQKKVGINSEDTAGDLFEKLASIGAKLLIKALDSIENKTVKYISQNDKKVFYAPMLKKQDGMVNWNNKAKDIYNFLRGMYPWPGGFTYFNGKMLKIYKAKFTDEDNNIQSKPGAVIKIDKNKGIIVKTAKGCICIVQLQLAGSKVMGYKAFTAGHKIKEGDLLGL